MQILLLTHFYMHLQDDIIKELRRQGHTVFVMEDKCSRLIDIRKVYNSKLDEWTVKAKHLIDKCIDIRKRYWKRKIAQVPQLSSHYDFFLCINGVSFDPCLMEHLKMINPNIRSSIYVWDSNKYANYFRSLPYFDYRFSFDWGDCEDNPEVAFLPFFWIPNKRLTESALYDISIVGSSHDGRAKIVKDVKRQLEKKGGINFLFRIYVLRFSKLRESLYRAKLFLDRWIFPSKDFYEKSLAYGVLQEDFVTYNVTSPSEVMEIMLSSRCILDTDREIQTGTTPRLIWALAYGKKVITTNSSLRHTPFFSKRQIQIIDRNSPVVDIDFIKNDEYFECPKFLKQCRIDNWVKIILCEKQIEQIL